MNELWIAGVDEVGRGPLAGPVIAAAVILDATKPIIGLRDSKKLSSSRREELSRLIYAQAVAVAIGRAEVNEIDNINILQASLLAMARAVEQLAQKPHKVLIDGHICPALTIPAEAIINGDDKIPAISAASIIAKVFRDEEMCRWEDIYPGYGFARHKGYGTVAHIVALEKLGVCPLHRHSFAPVRKYLKRALPS